MDKRKGMILPNTKQSTIQQQQQQCYLYDNQHKQQPPFFGYLAAYYDNFEKGEDFEDYVYDECENYGKKKKNNY